MIRGQAAVVVVALVFCVLLVPMASAAIQVGAGAHYWTTVDNIDFENVDEDGVSYYASVLLFAEYLLRVELDLEQLDAGYRGAEKTVYAPAAYVVLGKSLYVAAGIGGYFSDGDFHEDEFYALRVGFEMNLFHSVYLDVNANYRFDDWGDDDEVLKNIDTETVTLGGAIRLEF